MAYVIAQQVADSLMQGQGTGTSLLGTEVTDLEAIIDAVTQQIDERCGWSFTDDGVSTRTFAAADPHRLRLPPFCPLQTVTAVEVDTVGDGSFSTRWDVTDVELGPMNAPYRNRPYEWVNAVGAECFPVTGRGSVRITGSWGWLAVPPVVPAAQTLQSSRLWHRRHSPDGLAGLTTDGDAVLIVRIDPDVAQLLKPVSRTKLKIARTRLTTA